MCDIDQWLSSAESGSAFSHCVRCALPLLEVASGWLVNKEFHRGECIFEYAICQPCRDQVSEEFSEESKRAVRRFLETNIDWEERLREFMLHDDPAQRFDACVSCQCERGELDDFGISALFDAEGHLTEGPLPLLICGTCISEATAKLSQATREAWQRFLDEHFDGPPVDHERLPGSGMSGLI
jgi:hypothetical protein